MVHKKATLELAIKNYGCPSISIRKTKKEEMVGQVFSSSSFRFLTFGFLFMDSFISGWITLNTLIWSLTTRGLELLIKNYGCPSISIRKTKKEEMVGQVFFFFFVFFLSFSSFRFPLHGLLYIRMDHSYLVSDY